MVAMYDLTFRPELAKLVATAQLPQLYQEAKNALAACESMDECADWADKAAAIASYARQADDLELENYARRIRQVASMPATSGLGPRETHLFRSGRRDGGER
jgi:hypothetical protein